MEKGIRKKIALGFLKICKYTFFNIWKSGQAKKCCKISWRFVSILFLKFEKVDMQKNCTSKSFLKISKYTLFNISKRAQAKNSGIFF